MSAGGGRLSRMITRIRRGEPGFGRNVLALLVIVVAGVITGGGILMQQRFNPPWEDMTFVYATFSEAPALAPGRGQEVRMAGVTAGDIRESKLDQSGHALVLLAIDKSVYPGSVYENASVVLRPKSPLNEMYIEMDPGAPPAKALPDRGVLPIQNAKPPVQVDAALAHLDKNALAGLRGMLSAADAALARAPAELPNGLNAVNTVTKDLRPVVEELKLRRERIAALVTSVSQLSTAVGGNDKRLAELAASLQKTLGTVSAQNHDLRESLHQLPGLVDRLGAATGSVHTLSEQLDPTLDNLLDAAKELPDGLDRLGDTVDDLHSTVDRARPFAERLRAVSADLRPFVSELNGGLDDLDKIARDLKPITEAYAGEHMKDLQAFVYQTNSVTSVRDANGGMLRAVLGGGPDSFPIPGSTQLTPTQR